MHHLGCCGFHKLPHICVCLPAEWSAQGDPADSLGHVQPGGDTHQHAGLPHVYVVGTLAADRALKEKIDMKWRLDRKWKVSQLWTEWGKE